MALYIGGKAYMFGYASRIRWRVKFPLSYPAVLDRRKGQEMTDNQLLEGRVSKVLIRFALPFMAASLLQSVYGAVDLMVVGRYADSSAVSAVSIGSQLMVIATALIQGISMGGTVRIGYQIGRGDREKTGKAVGNTAFLFAVMALLLTPVMLLGSNFLIRVMQTPSEAVPDCRRYILICSAGIPFITGYNAVSGIYRGIGDSKTPVCFITIACVINVLLDFLLAGYFRMGTQGAAIATVAAQGIAFGCALIHMIRKGFSFPVRKDSFLPDRTETGAILKVGLPLAMQDVLVHFSFMAITAIINTLGLIASAAVGVAEKLMSFAFLIPGAFSSAVATMVAQNVGAGQKKRAVSSLYWGIGYSFVCGVAVCALCWLIPQQLTGIFSKDQEVVAAGAQYIGTYSIDCMLTAFVFNINAYLNGNGKSGICFIHSVAATFLVRIPVTWFMSRICAGSLMPMGLAAPAASLASIAICAVYFAAVKHRSIADK